MLMNNKTNSQQNQLFLLLLFLPAARSHPFSFPHPHPICHFPNLGTSTASHSAVADVLPYKLIILHGHSYDLFIFVRLFLRDG
jgi:hypothetical protein